MVFFFTSFQHLIIERFPPSIIEHCKRYYSYEFAFDNCCEEYKLHSLDEKVNREEYLCQELPHLSYDLHDEVLSHKHKLERSNEEAEGSPNTIIFYFHKYEELISLITNHEDQFSVGQKEIEISKIYAQFSVLQTRGNRNRQEEINL